MDLERTTSDKVTKVAEKALAKGVWGQQGAVAAGNYVVNKNAAPLAAAAQVPFAAPSITPLVSGTFRISATISGAMSAIDLPLTVQLVRGVTPIGPALAVAGGHAGGDEVAGGSVTWIDSTGALTPVVYEIQATTVGGTITVPANGASIIVEELPAQS